MSQLSPHAFGSEKELCILVVQDFLALFPKVLSDGVVGSYRSKDEKGHSLTVKIGFVPKCRWLDAVRRW